MALDKSTVLADMEAGWREFRHQLRDLDYSLDWKADPRNPQEWSVRDIVTHTIGDTELYTLRALERIMAGEAFAITVEDGNPHRSEQSRALQMAELLARVDEVYQCTVALVQAATPSQCEQKARLRLPSGQEVERSFLEAAQRAFQQHWREHAQQLYAIREQLGVAEL